MASSTTTSLQEARARIDTINERVVDLLAERQAIVDELCALKSNSGHSVRDPEREAELLAHVRSVAKDKGLSPDLAERLFEEILEHSVQRQRRQRKGEDTDSGEHATAEEAPGSIESWT